MVCNSISTPSAFDAGMVLRLSTVSSSILPPGPRAVHWNCRPGVHRTCKQHPVPELILSQDVSRLSCTSIGGNPCAINFTIHANVVPHYDHLLCSLSALFAARATQRMLEGRIFLETAQCTIFVKIHLQINFFQPQSSSTTMGDLWIFIFLK